ncbi:MAG: endonuclease MutS2 [Methanobacterium sp.]|nr:endonuclease MutS2 [Methanobacterium sp.]
MKEYAGDIRNIKGVGDRLFDKIMANFGGEDEFLQAARNFEVDRIASVDGVSQRRAIEIVNVVLGNPSKDFLKTEPAFEIYQNILDKILQYASTQYGKNRIKLLSPVNDEGSIQRSIEYIMNTKKAVSELPINEIRNLLKKLGPITKPKPKYNPSHAILIESKDDYHRLTDLGLNSYLPIINGDEIGDPNDFEFMVYVYSEGMIDLGDALNVVMVNHEAQDYEIVPDIILSFYIENHSLLSNILKIKKILGQESILDEVLDILDSLEAGSIDEDILDITVVAAKKKADTKLKKSIKSIDLKGDEVLDLLNEGMPGKIQKIFDEVIKDARQEIKDKTGCSFDPFIQKYPIEVDLNELERVKKQELAKKNILDFENKVKAANRLKELRSNVENEIREIYQFDYEFALGCFAHYYDLNPPVIGDGFSFKDGINLNLALNRDESIQKINYNLRSPDNVVLLTGANSGGKTTLLETLAQIFIMTQMGLPVCACESKIQLLDELYFFSKKRSLDAGAFESFLNTFMPIVTKKCHKLILLDELEAITELEAAVKIIASFMDYVRDSDSYAIIVTHMAREILKYSDVRVDGIEAQGLDENYNLIVDRSPRMNYFAKSTPELILKRMYEKSDGRLKEIYGEMLDKFRD